MLKYLLKRLLHGLVSVIIVVALVMILIFSLMDRESIFIRDQTIVNYSNNAKVVYMYSRWESYGYLDYVPYADYINSLARAGEIDDETRAAAIKFGRKPENDTEIAKEYIAKYTEYYESKGYTIIRLNAKMQSGNKYAKGGEEKLFAYKDEPLIKRLWNYFTGLIEVDNIHYAQKQIDKDPSSTATIENEGIKFTLHDPVYGGKFVPAIIGNGTKHKYLLYVDNKFPYIHQNLVTINLGTSYSVNRGQDIFETMTKTQGANVISNITYPTGLQLQGADDLHSAKYIPGSLSVSAELQTKFVDDYTNCTSTKAGYSRMGYSFIIGILSVIMAYLLGVPLGILMARKKDKFADKLGTIYIVFIIAVPSLAYIFMFKAIGTSVFKLPTTFETTAEIKANQWKQYILPIVSLALPSIASLMKWLRRYMIDQMNSDYVKFARSGGLSESEIFTKHIFKNASIPLIQGIPGSIIFSLTGAIITESVYVVPGVGNVLTKAISYYDNGVIVGVTLFYAILSVISLILGDILMAMVDPRISFSSKGR